MTNVVQLKRKAAPGRAPKGDAAIKDGLLLVKAFRRIKLRSDRKAVIALARKLAKKK